MSDLKALEQQRKDLKSQIEIGEALARLNNNRDFKKVILEELLIQEAARMIKLSTNLTMTPQQRADTVLMAQFPGFLEQWLLARDRQAMMAQQNLGELEDAILATKQELAAIDSANSEE